MCCRYRSRRDDSGLRERLIELLRRHEPEARINHKRVWRVYCDLGLSVHRKRLARVLRPRPMLTAPNQEWAIDFASDVAAGGRRLRIFSVMDCYTRECLTLEVDSSMPSRRVTRALAAIIETRGAPAVIRSDNGPEMTSATFWRGALSAASTRSIFSPASPRRTRTWKVFTGGCATSA